YSLLHRKKERDYHHLYLMSFFMLLAACILAPEPQIGLVMLLFIISAILSLITLHFHVELGRPRDAILPVILSTGQTEASAISPQRQVFDMGLVASVTLVSVASVFLTVALFVITPR